MQWRATASVLLISAIGLGTAVDRLPERAVLRNGDGRILAADFHVHSFPGDGGLPPWALRTEAQRAGVDVFAVTNHNQPLTGRLAQWVSGLYDGPIMIAGEEVTNADYHLIAVGIHARVSADQTAAQAIAAIHAQGGVAIAAHPAQRFHGWTDEAVAMLDGAEVAHPMIEGREGTRRELVTFYEHGRRLNPRLAAIGSSDVHTTPTLARCRTFLFARDTTPAAVLDAIRNGRTVAMDTLGRLYGPPELVELVAQAHPVTRVDTSPRLRRLSLGMALLGGLGVLLLGRSREIRCRN